MRYDHGITIDVPLLDQLRHYEQGRADHSDYERLETALGRLKYIDQVCLDHQCWVRCYLDTSRFDVAERRTVALKVKLDGVLRRWSATLRSVA